jgi:hypothetical protein
MIILSYLVGGGPEGYVEKHGSYVFTSVHSGVGALGIFLVYNYSSFYLSVTHAVAEPKVF